MSYILLKLRKFSCNINLRFKFLVNNLGIDRNNIKKNMLSTIRHVFRKMSTSLSPNQAENNWLVKNIDGGLPTTGMAATGGSPGGSVTLDVSPFKLHRLDEGPPLKATLTREEGLDMYRKMKLCRELEKAAGKLYQEKLIRGFCHLYTGQEAIAIGMKAAMRKNDTIITSYRCHAWTYLMGVSAEGILAELTGRLKGCSRGKGGSMHMYSPNFFGGNGIVGAQVPLGAGVALALKYKGDNGVSFALYGDGAANQGQVFEAYNIAYLWKLPVIFICENNVYGMGTKTDRHAMNTNFYERGDVIPGLWVDGMDALSCKNATQFCLDYAVKNGPLVVEMHTYRYTGHSMSDPGTSYRSREEVQDMKKTRDPIKLMMSRIIDNKLATEDDLKKINKEVKTEVDAATEVAKTDKEPGMEELTADIYANNLESKIRGTWSYNYKHNSIGKAVNL